MKVKTVNKNAVKIKYKNFDLLKIIPFPASDAYDFKIDFSENSYELRLHNLGKKYFEVPSNDFHLEKYEVTYHKKNEKNPAKFHLKSKGKQSRYYNIPLRNILDPTISPEFPIPFIKVGISNKDNFKLYKYKKKYSVLDIGNNNVIEMYLVNVKFDLDLFIHKWDVFDLIYTIAPMEYFVNGQLKNGFLIPKYNTLYELNTFRIMKININEDIALLINAYTDNNIDGIKQKSFVSIYENGEYVKYLSLAPINYFYKNGKKSEIKPAFVYQLQRCKDKFSTEDYTKWKKYFTNIQLQYKGSRQNLKLDGFSLEAVEKQ